jgi:undecaprenyl-diphosphatase
VTLHSGAAAALAVALRGELLPRTPRHCVLLALSVAPAALFGLAFERPIERHLGTPTTVAFGMLGGGLALVFSDRAGQTRRREDAGPGDALWLGLAQACALFPGVSRGGATLAAARMRGFARADASRLSGELALPVIAGAAVLKGTRARARRLPPGARAPFVAGAVASFASTLASRPLYRLGALPLAPYAAYRILLATAVLARARKARPPGSLARGSSRTSRR